MWALVLALSCAEPPIVSGAAMSLRSLNGRALPPAVFAAVQVGRWRDRAIYAAGLWGGQRNASLWAAGVMVEVSRKLDLLAGVGVAGWGYRERHEWRYSLQPVVWLGRTLVRW